MTVTEFDPTDHDCPNGHGPEVLYPVTASEAADGEVAFYECPVCGHQLPAPDAPTAPEEGP